MSFQAAARFQVLCTLGALVGQLLFAPHAIAQGGEISSDRPVYSPGQTVTIRYVTPDAPSTGGYNVFLVTPSPDPAICAANAPPASSGSCSFDPASFFHPDEVSPRLRISMTVMPDPGLNAAADGHFWVERRVEETPGALGFPGGTILRPWDAIAFTITNLPGLLRDYGALRVELARIARRYPGGGVEPSAGSIPALEYENAYYQPSRTNLGELTTRRASRPGGAAQDIYAFVPGESRFLPLGQYEFRLIGADDRIIDRETLSVEIEPIENAFLAPEPPRGGDAYPVGSPPQIQLVLSPEIASSPLPLGLVVQVARLGDNGSRQLVSYDERIADCIGWPDCAAGQFAADGSLRRDVGISAGMPGRYEVRLVLDHQGYQDIDIESQLILARQEFALEGTVEPWRMPPESRPVYGTDDVQMVLDQAEYVVGQTAQLSLETAAGVELDGQTLWLSLRNNQRLAYGCAPTSPLQLAFSAYSPIIGDAAPDTYSPVSGQPYDPRNDPSVSRALLDGEDYRSLLQQIDAEARNMLSSNVFSGPPGDAAYDIIPWIGWGESGVEATIALNVRPGRYRLALMRGTATSPQSDRSAHFADAQTLATVDFLVTAPVLDIGTTVTRDDRGQHARLISSDPTFDRLELDARIVYDADPGTGAIRPRRTGANRFRDDPGRPGIAIEVPIDAPFLNDGTTGVFQARTGTQYGWRHIELVDRYGLVRWHGALLDTRDPTQFFGLPDILYPDRPDIEQRSTRPGFMAPHVWMPSEADCGPNPPSRAPLLQAVVWQGGDPDTPDDDIYEPVEAVFPGFPFFLEAQFDDPPGAERYEIETSTGAVVIVERTGDPRVYRSEILTIQPESGE